MLFLNSFMVVTDTFFFSFCYCGGLIVFTLLYQHFGCLWEPLSTERMELKGEGSYTLVYPVTSVLQSLQRCATFKGASRTMVENFDLGMYYR